MPELPEVESLRQKLSPQILGKKILTTKVRRRDLRYTIPRDFEKQAKNSKVLAVRRRSKYLCIDLNNDLTWIIHLGMSGRLFFSHPKNKIDKHDHVLIEWEDQKQMRFRDPRRFGLMDLIATADLENHKFFKHLGVEPLSRSFNASYFYKICQNKKAPVKSFLMNAKYLVGVGNIYANEALFLSKIHPQRLTENLSKDEAKVLCQNVKTILKKSIQKGGTTFKDYIGLHEEPGLYRVHLNVYGKKGESCNVCKTPIESLTQAGRSTFFCPQCQS